MGFEQLRFDSMAARCEYLVVLEVLKVARLVPQT